MMKDLVESIASAYGVIADLTYERSVPPAVNEATSTQMIAAAADRVLGSDAIAAAPQSLGGEDFAWYLESIPGQPVQARHPTRRLGRGVRYPPADVRRGRGVHRGRRQGDDGDGPHGDWQQAG